ncbi:MAG: response regulator [Fluviicola sp.]|jgi:class 3 adenylate cyclase/predicted metal-dependent HD superfamily phosphohydrolase|nr:response regulator [Fluviicola sp.]
MERLINILIIDDNETDQLALREIIGGSGNILLMCSSIEEAHTILRRREVGIVLVNIDSPKFSSMEDLKDLLSTHQHHTHYTIVITENARTGSKLLRGLDSGAVDFINKPFNPNLIQAKIEVYKSLYYKDQRIAQLLGNILPRTVLEDLNQNGKFSPKRVDKGVVIFTDFVDFSMKSKSIKPLKLVKKLEFYFTRFDQIVERYKVEKIKTIGDAYMALAGVTEDNDEPVLRACMAALEMRDFMRNERDVARALKRDFWEIRIGVHVGPLVAGIIGSNKYSFDIWGDTVNIAARAQQYSAVDEITVTNAVMDEIKDFVVGVHLGHVPIKKRGGTMEVFSLDRLKDEHSLYGDGKFPNVELRKKCTISSVDFEHMRNDIINRLKSNLPEEVIYHDLHHTLNVEKAAMRLGRLEGLDEEEMLLLRTAALYHDAGFIFTYHKNELHGVRLMEKTLPRFGYDGDQIAKIRSMILATANEETPVTLLEQLMCDADHDYLGRADYYVVSSKLREEIATFGKVMTEEEWLDFQIRFLENDHHYYSITAINIRERAKKNRLQELKLKRKELQIIN